ncbi:MAG: UDP-N-acetylmuramoyl-L-alanyl-D-glutamate--2,6-diaminopimelate ligase [bacterium]|nr:UDP-N-acetylmuramoyl-L-alanyl-D-glutamate--2,6-diaminopimelate ligase [bacterium]
MKLKDIIKNLDYKRLYNLNNPEVNGIAYDSRKVKEKFIFVALKGTTFDGHHFINDAISRGAKIIVVSKKSPVLPSDVGEIVVEDTREALHTIAAEFYGHPSKKLRVVGITGTNGKTTTSFIIKHILEKSGNKCGLIGTISYQIGERAISSVNTTPESLDIQKLFYDMVEAGCNWAVMEVSSHGIAQGRISKINFDTGIFTNIASHEHLDYHKSFRNYLNAKLKFFNYYLKESEKERKVGIVNNDDKCAGYFIKCLKKNGIECITYGRKKSDIQIVDYAMKKDGNYLIVETKGTRIEFYTNLKGLGNIYNSLAGISFGISEGIPIDILKEALASITYVSGRFESVDEGQNFDVIVDYAHTHHALSNLLHSVKELHPKRIILVFGCGGDRDKTKRPLMGNIAVKMADIVFITSDNPRSEDPQDIIDDIEKGIPFYLRKKYVAIIDRKQAIKEAISIARENDCVVIAGKGHETFQILKNTVVPFDDREEARKAIRERLKS